VQDKFLEDINVLFSKKKFEEVVFKIKENSHILKNYPDLFNISGVSQILKLNYNKNDVISALNDFENYFLRSKINDKKIEAVCNYIATCVVNSQKYHEIITYFEKAKNLFEKCEQQVGYNERLYLSGVDLYKYILDHNKNRKLLIQLIKNKTKSKIAACAYGYMSNYTYDWGLKDYFDYSKNFTDYFPKHKVKDINEIEYKENKKIRIAFVSTDFKANHSITWMIKDTLLYFDKNQFETFGISMTNDILLKGSSQELKNNFDNWFDFSKLKNDEIITKLQDFKIEILIDTGGLFHAERIEIFNNRVAPIQISWVGYLNTVGYPTIDFLISDKNLIKEDEEKFYSEKIIKMSNIWNCHSGFKFKREFSELPIKKNKYITFGSFNNFLKISDSVVEVWSQILKKINNSKLILKSSLNVNKNIILEKFKKFGVYNSIEFMERAQDIEKHIKSYKKIDISLDTFPYNGGITTFEALWSGVPVIGMAGFNMMSRCGESILKNAKLKNLISMNKEDYVNKALYLSKNLRELEELRLKIFKDILNTSLFDSENFSINFQNKLLDIYKKTNHKNF
jgi:predicted O-linked N-acetylglucosamine transferase (SPINDLY family)